MMAKNILKNRTTVRYLLNEKRCKNTFSAMRLIPNSNQTDATFSISE